MGKKDRERLLDQVKANVDSLGTGEATLTLPEVRAMLASARCDTEMLRELFRTRCRQLAHGQRLKGKVPPTSLTEAIELTAPAGDLPNNPKTALEKAKHWVAGFQQSLTGWGYRTPEVLRAYRKGGELSEKDKQALDAVEEKFKRKLMEKQE